MPEDNMEEKSKEYGVFVNKGWGSEYWIANKKEYCGKILHFEEGKKCSWHYHGVKDETFMLLTGKMKIKLAVEDDIEKAQEIEFGPYDIINIFPGLRHQMIALEESDLLEISTQHFEEDSIRVVKGD